jgi:hypothetical protein
MDKKPVYLMGRASIAVYVARALGLGPLQYKVAYELEHLRGLDNFEVWSLYGYDKHNDLRYFMKTRRGGVFIEILEPDYYKCKEMREFEDAVRECFARSFVVPAGFSVFARRGNQGYLAPKVDEVYRQFCGLL